MKTSKRTLVVLLFAVVMLVVSGMAGLAKANVVLYDGPFGTTRGGLFEVTGDNYDFDTFCMERNETIWFGTSYLYDISDGAVKGGVAGGNPDPLDYKTAYLYTKFINNAFVTDNAHIDGLQLAIWKIEQEISNFNQISFATPAYAALVYGYAQGFIDSATTAAWGNIGDVRVMNIYRSVYDPQTQEFVRLDSQSVITMVPEPMTLLLLGLGLFGIGLGSRKLKIKK